MRRNQIIAIALVTTAALTLGAGTGAAADSSKETKVSCKIEAFAQGPQPSPSGIHLGFTTCPRPFGRGLHYNAYTVTLTGEGQGTVAGSFRNYYNRGTASGTFAMTLSTANMIDITYTGTVTYTGGTGRFKHVKGSGTIQCTTTDRGAHKTCAVDSTLTGI